MLEILLVNHLYPSWNFEKTWICYADHSTKRSGKWHAIVVQRNSREIHRVEPFPFFNSQASSLVKSTGRGNTSTETIGSTQSLIRLLCLQEQVLFLKATSSFLCACTTTCPVEVEVPEPLGLSLAAPWGRAGNSHFSASVRYPHGSEPWSSGGRLGATDYEPEAHANSWRHWQVVVL
jgi:hypothetical protein